MSYENMFPFNGRAIQALKISEAGFNVFVFFDAQLYANELADAVERGEKTNNTNAVKLDSEMKRRAKGTPRLTNEELQALQPQDLMEIHSEIPEMGTVTIRTNRTDLNCMQVYSDVYKQHRKNAVSQSPLVDDGDGVQLQQALQRVLQVAAALRVVKVLPGQQHLGHRVVVLAEQPVIGVHQLTLAHGCRGLVGGDVTGLLNLQLADAEAGCRRGNNNQLVAGVLDIAPHLD